MTWTRTLLLSSAAIVLFFAGASAQAQATGYWQYVRTETYYWSCSAHAGLIGYGGCGAYPDTGTGSEGAYTVIVNNTQVPTPQFGGTFYWSQPPTILVPGTAPDWPIAAKLVANDGVHAYHQMLQGGLYPYAPTSNLDTFSPYATTYTGTVDLWGNMSAGTIVSYNNAQQSQPAKICALSSICGDAQGRLSWLVWISSTSTWYWNYVYQWVPGATPGSCGGTCGLAVPGQTIGANGGNGSVAVTATSTWDVIAVSNWITITSPSSGKGSGNGTVSFTVSANTGPPRSGAILVGGQTYAVHQDGLAPGTTAGCTYQMQPNAAQNVAAAGGSGTIQITAGQNCAWTAATTASWITIKSGSSGTGNGTVSYTAAPNDSTLPRSAPIVIAGQNVAINQAGGGGTGSSIYLRFENGTAGTAPAGSIADSSGAGQAGTPSGTLTYRSDVPVSSLPGTSTANNLSLEFGSSGVIQFSSAFPLNTLTNATMESWIKPTGSAAEMDFLWTRTNAIDANRFNMGVLTSGSNRSIFLDYRDESGAYHPLASSIAISATGWTHVAVVKSGNTWTSYANGIQQGTPVNDANAVLPTNTGWTLNGRGSTQYTGLLDEFRISNSALSPSQFLCTGGQISAAGVTNGASFAAGLTPGSIVTIFGVGIAKGVTGILLASSLPLPTTLGGVSVSIGGVPAPLFAVANVGGQEQINLQVPYEITGQTTVSIQVNANGVLSNTVQMPVSQAHPGIFTVDGKAGAILHGVSNALVTASNPAAPNEVIVIYAAGLGPVSPAPKTGYGAPTAEPLARTTITPTVTIGGVSTPVLFSGLAPSYVGLYQVNVTVPAGTAAGSVPVVISAGGVTSNTAYITVAR